MEKYILGQSEMKELNKENPEIRIDLYLEENKYFENALIYGHIRNDRGSPLEGVKIKFVDENGNIIGYVYSSNDGYYTYNGVKLNTKIRIEAEKNGYKLHRSCYINIKSRRIIYNIILEEEAYKFTLITGHVFDECKRPIAYITITLFKNEKLYKYTCTNKYGQFIFSSIVKGKYKLVINDSKYCSYETILDIEDLKRIYKVDILLEDRVSKTKINGNIYDENNTPIEDALVILYKIEKDKYIPIDFRFTDEFGKYEFEDMPYGDYIVKAVY
ncbi:Carboxypeptidase regulatory-like domain-containing protein [Caloranaerobacter azorensis DSM 13643]|uniref:Carboxypeptidase regulatory-like domain-containing protein n=1 Tax=Caloranaerobacter azorensis DSM 13643 TaxID=1121264 RepID=A0A1M5SWC1_9FIRM|nr:carboxypeptidase-like regulatory domain-containing protein [Caloranaerobacter azorensis]SHH42343.1 Carboxypeptidase regulatory-like domain-containing protein [Caloranaerobacter azorensis DSM 13643]